MYLCLRVALCVCMLFEQTGEGRGAETEREREQRERGRERRKGWREGAAGGRVCVCFRERRENKETKGIDRQTETRGARENVCMQCNNACMRAYSMRQDD